MSGSYHHSSENSSHYGQSPNTTHYGRPPNTSHYGNGQSSHYGQPPTNHYGIASNMYANVNVNYEIPDQSGYASGMNPMPSPISSGCYEFQVNQKLDQLLGLVNSQKTETTKLQSEINKLKQDVQDLRATKATVSSSNKLPLDLSAAVRNVQDKSEDSLKFLGNEPYKSNQNQKVKSHLMGLLTLKYAAKYSPRKVKKAIHRYYESRRRLFNDEQPGRKDIALKAKREAKKQEKRKRVYIARRKCLKREKDINKWSEINYTYMTEESSGEDNSVNIHRLPWRSEELNKLVIKAEKKIAKMDSKKQKIHIEKSPSLYSKPINAPKWTFNDACAVEPHEYTPGIADTVIEQSTAITASTTAATTASATASTTAATTAATTPRRIISNPPARQVLECLENNYEDTSSDYSSESDTD